MFETLKKIRLPLLGAVAMTLCLMDAHRASAGGSDISRRLLGIWETTILRPESRNAEGIVTPGALYRIQVAFQDATASTPQRVHFLLYENGRNVVTKHGTWSVVGDKLILEIDGRRSEEYIRFINPNRIDVGTDLNDFDRYLTFQRRR